MLDESATDYVKGMLSRYNVIDAITQAGEDARAQTQPIAPVGVPIIEKLQLSVEQYANDVILNGLRARAHWSS